MSKDQLDQLEQKKQQLEEELKQIQHQLDDSLDEMRADVSKKLDPVQFIREHPLPSVGVAVLLGFLAGHRSQSSGKSFVNSMLLDELKKVATKKALSFATDYIEEVMDVREEIGEPDSGKV